MSKADLGANSAAERPTQIGWLWARIPHGRGSHGALSFETRALPVLLEREVRL